MLTMYHGGYVLLLGLSGLHFPIWIDSNGVAFSVELLEWSHTVLRFGGNKIPANRD